MRIPSAACAPRCVHTCLRLPPLATAPRLGARCCRLVCSSPCSALVGSVTDLQPLHDAGFKSVAHYLVLTKLATAAAADAQPGAAAPDQAPTTDVAGVPANTRVMSTHERAAVALQHTQMMQIAIYAPATNAASAAAVQLSWTWRTQLLRSRRSRRALQRQLQAPAHQEARSCARRRSTPSCHAPPSAPPWPRQRRCSRWRGRLVGVALRLMHACWYSIALAVTACTK